jgi:REP element-mobilizing transposase RayT
MLAMEQSTNLRHGGPPHNPGLRAWVVEKRHWLPAPKREDARRGFRGWHERGYFAHRDEPGLTQFVTFRVTNSFPMTLRSEWEHLWIIGDNRKRHAELEAYLDKGFGECHLKQPQIARVVEDGLKMFHGERYELHAWCIMANHVHVLFKTKTVPMSRIVESWKKHTASRANRLLKRRGAFWAEDYFDIYMRDAEHERKTVRYIENNPTKAKLVLDPKEWLWSSARVRDEFGVLRLG